MDADADRMQVLCFVHGIRTDDSNRDWRTGLDRALSRMGLEGLDQRGLRVAAPSYLDLLDREEDPRPIGEARRPAKPDRRLRDSAASRYWAASARLERFGVRDSAATATLRGRFPLDAPGADAIVDVGFAQAARYRASRRRREAIRERILAAIPDDSDLVLIGHSLGSVVVCELIHWLPRSVRVRLMVTAGSPLAMPAMHEHLVDAADAQVFPYERVDAWVNLRGREDFVTGYRGLGRIFPEALDLRVDTGGFTRPLEAHSGAAYMDQDVLALALHWLDEEHRDVGVVADSRMLPDTTLSPAMLPILIGAQYALRLEQSLKRGDRRDRFGDARHVVMEELRNRLAQHDEAGTAASRLMLDNAAVLRGRLDQRQVAEVLTTAHTTLPLRPYEIELLDAEVLAGLRKLADDLEVPSHWATTVVESVKAARAAHKNPPWKRAALAAVGIAAIAAMPPIVLALAPAGLAGAAAVTAGLAALGPGGMLGGIGIVGAVGGTGGAVTARALLAGSTADVEQTVIYLQALALVHRRLGLDADGVCREWDALTAMEDVAGDQLAKQKLYSEDDAASLVDARYKAESLDRALRWFDKKDLAPVTRADPKP